MSLHLKKTTAAALAAVMLILTFVNMVFAADTIEVGFEGMAESATIYRNENDKLIVNVLSDLPIDRVEIAVDGTAAAVLRDAPYVYDLSTLGYGSYIITAAAYDTSDNIGEASLALKVAGKTDTMLFKEDFESIIAESIGLHTDFEDGIIPESLKLTNSENISVKDNPDKTGNPSAKALYIDGSDKSKVAAVYGFDSAPDKFSVSYKIYPEQIYNYYALYVGGYNSGRFVMRDKNFMDDVLKKALLTEKITDRWYDIKINVDNTEKKYNVYIDGDDKGELPFAGTDAGKNCYFQINANNPGAFYIDDINISSLDNDDESAIGNSGIITKENNGYYAVTEADDEHGKALAMYTNGVGNPYTLFPVQTGDSDIILWTADIKPSDKDGDLKLKVLDEDRNEYELIDLGDIEYNTDEWHHFETEINTKNETYSISFDGQKIAANSSYGGIGDIKYVGAYLSGIKSVTLDNITAFSRMITEENPAPTVKFVGYDDFASLTVNELGTLTVDAADADGIAYVEFYIDSVLKSTADKSPYGLDIRDLSPGSYTVTARAYDIYGKSSDAALKLQISDVFEKSLFTQNYNNLTIERTTVESKPGDGSTLRGQRGYYMTDVIDSEHQNSLKLGIDENYDSTNNAGAMAQYLINTVTTNAVFGYSLYFSDTLDARAEIMQYAGSATTYSLLSFADDGTISVNGSKIGKTYESGRWYNIEISVNLAEKYCSIIFDGEVIGKNIPIPPTFTSLTHIRIYGPSNEKKAAFLAIDDIFASRLYYTPSITDIGSGFKVSYDAETIEISLSDAVYPSSVNSKRLAIYDEFGGNVEIASVLCSDDGKTITIKLSKQLNSNSRYTVVLDKNIELDAGHKMNVDVSGNFTTTVKDIGIEDINIAESGNGTEITVKAVNNESDAKEIYIIAAVWNGDIFMSMKCFTIELAPLSNETKVFKLDKTENEMHTEVYAWNGFDRPVSVAKKIYSYKK